MENKDKAKLEKENEELKGVIKDLLEIFYNIEQFKKKYEHILISKETVREESDVKSLLKKYSKLEKQ